MVIIDKEGKGHFKGEAVKLTGRKDDTTYSIAIYELEYLEGPYKGEKIWNVIEEGANDG